jgi:hypothetical protein
MTWSGCARALAAALALGAPLVLDATSAGASTHFRVSLSTGGSGDARSATPAAPSGVSASCSSSTTVVVKVTWAAAAHATAYAVYESKTSGSYDSVASVTTTSWTSGSLTSGKYKFELSASIGTKWVGPKSSATASYKITKSKKTCS